MKRTALITAALLFALSTAPCFVPLSSAMPPPPSNKRVARPDASERDKADRLYRLLRKENRRLLWDRCLARKAFLRAKEMVVKGYFDHEDPATGQNPVWDVVLQCFKCRTAGENLAKGMNSAEKTHEALMRSPTHRRNILNPRFNRVGVGCYDYVCVELFAGL